VHCDVNEWQRQAEDGAGGETCQFDIHENS
jgi:hypothetical protein